MLRAAPNDDCNEKKKKREVVAQIAQDNIDWIGVVKSTSRTFGTQSTCNCLKVRGGRLQLQVKLYFSYTAHFLCAA